MLLYSGPYKIEKQQDDILAIFGVFDVVESNSFTTSLKINIFSI